MFWIGSNSVSAVNEREAASLPIIAIIATVCIVGLHPTGPYPVVTAPFFSPLCGTHACTLVPPLPHPLPADAVDSACYRSGRGCWLSDEKPDSCTYVDSKGGDKAYVNDCKVKNYALCYGTGNAKP